MFIIFSLAFLNPEFCQERIETRTFETDSDFISNLSVIFLLFVKLLCESNFKVLSLFDRVTYFVG